MEDKEKITREEWDRENRLLIITSVMTQKELDTINNTFAFSKHNWTIRRA